MANEQCHKPKRVLTTTTFFFFWWLIFFFFLCADLWTVWNCNLNVLIFLVSDLSADWHNFFSIYFNLHPTLGLTWEDTHAVICQNVFDIEETKMYSWDDIAWFIIFLILYVYLVSQLMMGMIRWCFYQNPESAMFKRFQSCWLIWYFLSLCCLSVLSPWGVYIFTVLLHVALWAFSLDAANPEARSWKISVELLLKCFSLWLNPVNFVKSTTWLQVGHQTSQVIQRVWPSIVTQVSIGGGFTCYLAVLLELLYSLLMAALSYPLPPPPKNVHL